MTGISAEFKGEGCGPCFKEWIANGDIRSCPGNKRGCRNRTSVLIVDVPDGFTIPDYFGIQNAKGKAICAREAVTAHGDVYAYKDHVVVQDDKGNELYNGPWVEEGSCGGGGGLF